MERVISSFMRLFLLSAFFVLHLVFKVSGNREGDALNALKNSITDPNNVLQNWDNTLVTPCTWFRVTCDSGNSVTRVDLGNANLSGELVPQLGQLTNLQYLEFYSNNITGKIPNEIGNLTNLVGLDLYYNSITGSIPDNLANLKKLRFFFKSNPLLNQITMTPAPRRQRNPSGNGNRAIGAIVGGVAVCAALLFLAPIIALVYWKKRRPQDYFFDVAAEEDSEAHLGQLRSFPLREVHLSQLKKFSLHELQVATDSFSNKNVIGRGGFGKVYKGRLTNGELVAVKRLKEERTQGGEMQFQNEVEIISIAKHRNLLRLRGFCMTATERLLVYPFMVNGSVASWLRDRHYFDPR